MKEKKLETLLYSSAGVAVMAVIIIAVNLIMGAFKSRIDLTEEKAYTLNPGTRRILQKLDGPVEVRLYYSQSETRMPSHLKSYARHVEDLLSEFRQVSKGNIEIKKFDPEPDSEAEELAQLDGIEPQLLPTGDQLYLGVAISQDPVKVALPFLPPDRERLLEYDLARALSKVISTNKPAIGVMTPLPMFGMPMNPMMMRMGQQGQEPWALITELKRDFDVRQVPMETEKIEDDIKVLLVIHPKDIKDTAQYAIDQFVMRGGKLVAMLDASAVSDRSNQNPQMMGMMPGGPSSLDKLLQAWGIQFENTKVVADMNYARQLRGPNNQAQIMPAYLFVTSSGINKEEVVCSQLDEVLLPLAGAFSGTPAAGLKQTVLLKTTTDSQFVDSFMAHMGGQKIVDEFKPSGTAQNLAIRLTGKFKTAYPDGKPAAVKDEKEDAENKEEKKEEKVEDQIKETKGDNVVVLIADSDFIAEPFSGQTQVIPFFNQKVFQPRFGNLTLVQNLVEQMAGDENLIGSRSRATQSRPFTLIKEMQKQANLRFQDEIKKLEQEQQEAQQRLNELQQAKKETGQQRFILSPEQQAEIAKFRQKEADAKRKLRDVRKDLKKDIDSLENRLKWANIAGMPLLVAIAGIVLAVLRKQRTKAK